MAILAADLVVLSDMLANILARQAACQEENIQTEVGPQNDNFADPFSEDICLEK
ncbi:MAG: DUF6774 domain-containing protein [Lachnospiraceae bacterium]